MPSLKETKERIASVGSTLKITSAMKMVASSKLRKAQQAIANMLPYERELRRILTDLMASTAPGDLLVAERPVRRVAIVAFSSNSSLCGAFNSNVIKEVLRVVNEYRAAGLPSSSITVYSIGRKMQDAMKKAGFPSPEDYSRMADSPSYDSASALAQRLIDDFSAGAVDKVELIYNHFKSTASQITMRETYLPMGFTAPSTPSTGSGTVAVGELRRTTVTAGSGTVEDMIIEPSPAELMESLLPKVVRLRIFTTLLDSNAAEHAARTVAMQTATDNGNELLQKLTLEYNKGRQQKITSEILDIVGGSMQ